jgi:hypothetical protein
VELKLHGLVGLGLKAMELWVLQGWVSSFDRM